MIPDRLESGASLLVSTQLNDALKVQLLGMVGLNRGDWLARPRLEWTFDQRWRWALGLDLFDGRRDGLFGQYADKNRLYTEVQVIF
jgi:hypothetical protein